MNNQEILAYHNKLKDAYVNSNLQYRYIRHIHNVFNNIAYDMNKDSIRVLVNGKMLKAVPVDGFYPEHLCYPELEISSWVHYSEFHGSDGQIRYGIKKELLRKIFLFALENFLSEHNYGIEFAAIHSMPINSIPFTLEYTGSGKVCQHFFHDT